MVWILAKTIILYLENVLNFGHIWIFMRQDLNLRKYKAWWFKSRIRDFFILGKMVWISDKTFFFFERK